MIKFQVCLGNMIQSLSCIVDWLSRARVPLVECVLPRAFKRVTDFDILIFWWAGTVAKTPSPPAPLPRWGEESRMRQMYTAGLNFVGRVT